ncbi:MAG: flagellar hook-length control protein FliK [Candidatus Acidiferrales bacterium]
MLTIAAQAAPQDAAAAPSFGARSAAPAQPGSFDSVLSSKTAAHESAASSSPKGSSSIPNGNRATPSHDKPHGPASAASATQTNPAIAAPAQPEAVVQASPKNASTGADSVDGSTPISAESEKLVESPSAGASASAWIGGLDEPQAALAAQSSALESPDSQSSDPMKSHSSDPARDSQTQSAPASVAPDSALLVASQNSAITDGQLFTQDLPAGPAVDSQTVLCATATSGRAEASSSAAGRAPDASGITTSHANSAGLEPQASGINAGATDVQNSQSARAEDSKSNPTNAASTAVTSNAPRLQFVPLDASTVLQNQGVSVSSSSHGTLQLTASDSAKTVSAPADASGSSHTGSDGQSSDPKSSDSNSAAAQTAGLAQTAVGGPLHAPAGPSVSTEVPASPSAATASPSALTPSNSLVSIASRPAPLPPAAPSSLNDAVQASQLYQHVGGAEMHIVMSTDLLGAVDVHAVVRQSTVSATIGVQRPEVQSLLASDLPSLQHALSEHSLHVEQISVFGGSTGNQMDMGRQSPQNQRSWQSPLTPSSAPGYEGDSIVARSVGSSTIAVSAGNYAEGRLSIHV